MFSRSMRAETRNRARDELKRVINSIERVRKWEKKWVVVKDTTMKIFKWVPMSDQGDAVPVFAQTCWKLEVTDTLETPANDRRKALGSQSAAPETDEGAAADASKPSADTSQDAFLPHVEEDSSQGTGVAAASERLPVDFSALNEDSNAGFSEAGFDSDSNQAFSTGNFGSSEDSTDFSLLAAAADAENAQHYIPETEEDPLSADTGEPCAKRLKTM